MAGYQLELREHLTLNKVFPKGQLHGSTSFSDARYRFRDMEERVRNMEEYVTGAKYEFEREMRRSPPNGPGYQSPAQS